MLPLLVVLLCCSRLIPASSLQFGVVSPARLSKAVLLAAGNQTAHAQCARDLRRWGAALSSGERWAAEMADSWSKSVTGLFHGNKFDLGDIDECIQASSESRTQTPSSLPIIRGAYLLPGVYVAQTNKSVSAAGALLSQVTPVMLRVALCVPDSCHPDLLVAALGSVAQELLKEEGLSESFVASVSLIAGRVQSEANAHRLGAGHWIFLAAVSFLVLLAMVGTVLDKTLDATESRSARYRWRSLLHFSLCSGSRHLLAPAPPASFRCINGLRVLSTLWIVVGHTFGFHPPVRNSWDLEQYTKGYPSMLLSSFVLGVDTFLTIGGLVCCFSFMRAVNKSNSFNWIKYTIHRYARTTPAVAIVVLYGATWFNVVGLGADSYDMAGTSFTLWYQKYWWTALLHLSNYIGSYTAVMPHVWYVSVDMQLYVLAPIVLIPLWKRPLAGKVLLALVTVAGCLVPGIISVAYRAKTDCGPDDGGFETIFDMKKLLYAGVQARIATYAIGIAVGYILYQLKDRRLQLQVTVYHATAMWLTSAALMLAVIFGPLSLLSGGPSHPYSAAESFFYLGFAKLAWGVAIALVILACETGWGGPVNKFLSMGIFSPLGKLSYSIYLVHYMVVFTDMLFLVHSVEYFSAYALIRRVVSSTAFSVVIAAAVFLIVEQPLTLIETELWK